MSLLKTFNFWILQIIFNLIININTNENLNFLNKKYINIKEKTLYSFFFNFIIIIIFNDSTY